MKKMKILTGAMALMAVVATTGPVMATRHDLSPLGKAQSTFLNYFPAAAQVSWSFNGGTSVVNFKLGDDPVMATFGEQGQLLASYRTIPISELPLDLGMRLNENFKGVQVRHIVECADRDTHFYVITLEGKNQWIQLKADELNGFTVLQQFSKA